MAVSLWPVLFMLYLIENNTGHNDTAIDYLKEQAERVRKESEAADAKLQQYMKDKQLLSLDSSQNMVADALKAAYIHKQDAQLSLLRLDDMVKQIEDFKA